MQSLQCDEMRGYQWAALECGSPRESLKTKLFFIAENTRRGTG
jgi:hypothetical protein